jgi:hypothetical protein
MVLEAITHTSIPSLQEIEVDSPAERRGKAALACADKLPAIQSMVDNMAAV